MVERTGFLNFRNTTGLAGMSIHPAHILKTVVSSHWLYIINLRSKFEHEPQRSDVLSPSCRFVQRDE